MNRIVAFAVLGAGLASIAAAADVGVSIQFAQPGVFGRVDIGQFPQPQVIVPTPVLIQPPPGPPPEAIYLWVPLEHRQHWDRYCHQYHACGHPVYFVNHVWYRNNVVAHRERVEARHDEHRGKVDAHHEEHRDHGEGERGRERDDHEHR